MRVDVRAFAPHEYDGYDHLVDTSPQGCVFMQRWWIDVVTGGGGRLLGCFDGERLLGAMPIWPTATLGVRRLRQPPLTPYWGPMLAPHAGSASERAALEVVVLRAFARALGAWRDATVQCHPTLLNGMPFQWQGFTQTTRYTYRLAGLPTAPQTEDQAPPDVRHQLRRARRHGLEVREGCSPALVGAMYERVMRRQGLSGTSEVIALWPRLAAAAAAHGCLHTTEVLNPDGSTHTALAMVWDTRCAYGLFGGTDPRHRHTPGGTLASWYEIQAATGRVREYDFEGSMMEPVERFFRKFGGTLTPYMLVARHAAWELNAARAMQRQVADLQRWTRTLGQRAAAPAPPERAEVCPAVE